MHDKHELLTFINAFLTDRHHSEETISSLTADVFRLAKDCLEAKPVAYVMSDDLIDKAIISTPAYIDKDEAEERTVGDLVALYRR